MVDNDWEKRILFSRMRIFTIGHPYLPMSRVLDANVLNQNEDIMRVMLKFLVAELSLYILSLHNKCTNKLAQFFP